MGCPGLGGGVLRPRGAPSRGRAYDPVWPAGPTVPCCCPPPPRPAGLRGRAGPGGSPAQGVWEAWLAYCPQQAPQNSSGQCGWAGGVPGCPAAGREGGAGPQEGSLCCGRLRVAPSVPGASFQLRGHKPTAPSSASSPGPGHSPGCLQPPGRRGACLGEAGGNPCLQEPGAGGSPGRLTGALCWSTGRLFSAPVPAHTRTGTFCVLGRPAWSRRISRRREVQVLQPAELC